MENAVFPSELDKLGQKETENYIAVVHIDGNNMGKKFADLTTLSAYKNKSQEIRTATIRAFAELVLSLKEDSFPFLAQRKDAEKRRYLPVRPLILGGDDMTFVCAAKVAFDCTAFIMKSLLEKGVDTCAGVAILPTAYPFFRGYEIAEQLCDSAKGRMMERRRHDGSLHPAHRSALAARRPRRVHYRALPDGDRQGERHGSRQFAAQHAGRARR